jgi:molybdopterin/thiamine biosynthesis adenylyltransferase
MFYNVISQLGEEAFKKVERTRVALVGSGGIGSSIAPILAGTGFKHFTLIDGDKVSRRNIPLSAIFTNDDVGKYKVHVVEEFLNAKYPGIHVRSYPTFSFRVRDSTLISADLVVIGVDDRWTKYSVSGTCLKAQRPYVILGFLAWEATYMLVIPRKTACWACLWRPADHERVERLKREGKCPELEPNVPGVTIPGLVQHLVGFAAQEILKFFTSKEKLVQYYRFNAISKEEDLRFLDSESEYFKPDSECPLCSVKEEVDIAELGRPRSSRD